MNPEQSTVPSEARNRIVPDLIVSLFFIVALVFYSNVAAGSPAYNLKLFGGSSAAGALLFQGDLSIDGVFPLLPPHITAFDLSITETDIDVHITVDNINFAFGGDYQVVGGELVLIDLQTFALDFPGCGPCQFQSGNFTPGVASNFWAAFGVTRFSAVGTYVLERDTTPISSPNSALLLGMFLLGSIIIFRHTGRTGR